jgi:hypothetical protein
VLAGIQIMSVPDAVDRLSLPNKEVLDLARRAAYPRVMGICLFLPLFLSLAIWRWRIGPPIETSTPDLTVETRR